MLADHPEEESAAEDFLLLLLLLDFFSDLAAAEVPSWRPRLLGLERNLFE